VGVIGHTDTLGDKLYNLNLSMRRAAAVRDLLVQNGVPAKHMETTSHGEKNLLIKTGDNVGEPKNRRVEVVVR
jgi:outer membrane protein OmpA-like peptidoglycan-associated protein